jgi:hypothetical protein
MEPDFNQATRECKHLTQVHRQQTLRSADNLSYLKQFEYLVCEEGIESSQLRNLHRTLLEMAMLRQQSKIGFESRSRQLSESLLVCIIRPRCRFADQLLQIIHKSSS